jgi:hypothetical protein
MNAVVHDQTSVFYRIAEICDIQSTTIVQGADLQQHRRGGLGCAMHLRSAARPHLPTCPSTPHHSRHVGIHHAPQDGIYQFFRWEVCPSTIQPAQNSVTMTEQLEVKDAYVIDESSFPYIFEQDVAVPLKTSSSGIIRCNVYRPKSTKEGTKLPVLVTYGPYGKDIHYKEYAYHGIELGHQLT